MGLSKYNFPPPRSYGKEIPKSVAYAFEKKGGLDISDKAVFRTLKATVALDTLLKKTRTPLPLLHLRFDHDNFLLWAGYGISEVGRGLSVTRRGEAKHGESGLALYVVRESIGVASMPNDLNHWKDERGKARTIYSQWSRPSVRVQRRDISAGTEYMVLGITKDEPHLDTFVINQTRTTKSLAANLKPETPPNHIIAVGAMAVDWALDDAADRLAYNRQRWGDITDMMAFIRHKVLP